MTDVVVFQAPQSPAPARKWKGVKAPLGIKWGSKRSSEDHASFYMLSLFRTDLGVRLRSINESSLESENQRRIYSAVTEMLKVPAKASMTARNLEWDESYKAESLIALLSSGRQLRQEIRARLQELAKVNQAEADTLSQEYEEQLKQPADSSNSGPDDSIFHAILLRVMEALHWSQKKKSLARPLRIEATNRILKCLMFSFFLLVVPYVVLIWDYNSTVHEAWSLFALYTALTAGLLGAFSSRLNSIQRQWANMSLDEVFLQREWSYTLLRAGVGVCGALVVYFFLRSGIAEGALFPKFEEIRIQLVTVDANGAVPMAFVMPSKSLSLLTFWCFLAGFSETLVSSILRSTEQDLTDAAAPARAARK